MKTLKTLLLVTSAALLAACASTKDCGTSCASKQSAACSTSTSCSTGTSCSTKPCAVPANILAAAKSSVPGFAMTSYDTDTDNGRKVYELDGTANGRQCEIKVDANGKVLKIDRD
jgi:hypothetical protein